MERLPELIQTERLTLRLWTQADAAAMAATVAANIQHLRPWMPWIVDEPLSPEARLALIEGFRTDWDAGGDAVYGVFLDGVPVGGTGLHRRGEPTLLEIGYWVHVDHIGNGIATELTAGLTTTAFAQPGIDTVVIRHDRANARSRRVPEKLGYVLVAETDGEVLTPGDEGVDCTWAMTRDRWPSAAPTFTTP